jgi:hypothetical protein
MPGPTDGITLVKLDSAYNKATIYSSSYLDTLSQDEKGMGGLY